ncbi:MAG: hypothetical protein NXI31_19200 [bacterium]|nr:hypothetical protein [bacterium]
MKPQRRLLLLPFLTAFTACGISRDWQEIKTAPMSRADCYDGLVFVATRDKYAPDIRECDRGLGTWQSRWRVVTRERFGLYRYRLIAEMLLDEGSAQDGWIIRYLVEQEKVSDPRRDRDPQEGDWKHVGQEREAEALLRARLERKLGPKP